MKKTSFIIKLCYLAIFVSLCYLATFIPMPTYAAERPATEKAVKPGQKTVQSILEGRPASFSGMLVPEARFTELMKLELKVEDLKGRLKIQTNLTINLEDIYITRMEQMAAPQKWYQTGEFKFWLGFTLGLAATGATIYGAVKIVEASK